MAAITKPATYVAPVVAPTPSIPERALTASDVERTQRYANSVLMQFLDGALSIKRPHNGAGERQLLGMILRSLPADADWHFDAAGNLHVDMRAGTSTTLFVAHVDTVHRDDGANLIDKTPSVWYASGSQLGADDGAGVAMLMHMLHGGVPAYYLFTVGEECGGVGAKYVADHYAHVLSQCKRAVAFDRRGTNSVITYQGWGRCCSDDFGYALADAFSGTTDDLIYTIDDTGVYTDTAEFVDIIPECTNISIGYQREHSTAEALDVLHVYALADACLAIDWETLPVSRDPLLEDNKSWGYGGDYGTAKGSWYTSPVSSATSIAANGYAWADEDYCLDYTPSDADDCAIDLLYYAVDTGNVAKLSDLMAKSVYPENPDSARKLCVDACRKLIKDDEFVENCVQAILEGFPVDDVMLDIYSSFSCV